MILAFGLGYFLVKLIMAIIIVMLPILLIRKWLI